MSQSITKIAPALVKAQKAITAATKSAENPHFRSKYADLTSVIDAVKGPLNDNGIAILQNVTSVDGFIWVTTTLLHESTEWVASSVPIPTGQQTAQAYGSAVTYGRRYSLQNAISLPTEDDDGNEASVKTPKPEREYQAEPHHPNKEAFDALPQELKDVARTHASALIKLHKERGDVVSYMTARLPKTDQEMRMAVWHLLQPHSAVRSWTKDQEKMAEMTGIGRSMKATELGSQA